MTRHGLGVNVTGNRDSCTDSRNDGRERGHSFPHRPASAQPVTTPTQCRDHHDPTDQHATTDISGTGGEHPTGDKRTAARYTARSLPAGFPESRAGSDRGEGGRSSVVPCGSWAAYKRHKRRGEQPDEGCVEAMRERSRQHYYKHRDRYVTYSRTRYSRLRSQGGVG